VLAPHESHVWRAVHGGAGDGDETPPSTAITVDHGCAVELHERVTARECHPYHPHRDAGGPRVPGDGETSAATR